MCTVNSFKVRILISTHTESPSGYVYKNVIKVFYTPIVSITVTSHIQTCIAGGEKKKVSFQCR
jgi:hypothetical protein